MASTEEILRKYGAKIEGQMRDYNRRPVNESFSKSYREFKAQMVPEFSRYERWCKALGNFFRMKVAEKDRARIEKAIEGAHLDLSASEVMVFSTVVLMLSLFGGILFFVGLWLITGAFSLLFLFLTLILSVFLFYYFAKTPERLAMLWRLKASSQMVPAILYIVIYMKHTSNFEKAVSFAAEHLQPPLSLDLRKVFWDVEVGRFPTLKESLDNYLNFWKGYSREFVEAFHLIESSLYETDEGRRIGVLEKSLQVILDGVYDKMLKYTHDVKAPLTNVYMLGIVLPTLALAILPLASTMLGGAIRWYHVVLIFNVIVPLMVLYMTGNIMMGRPGGYGEASLLEKNPLYPEYRSKKHFVRGALIAFPFFLIGIIPLLWRYSPLPELLGLARDYSWKELGIGFLGDSGVFGIVKNATGDGLVGPFGTLSLVLSLFIPLSVAVFFITAYKGKTSKIIRSREEYMGLEEEFTSSLFQLGNRIGDGVPAEIAFSRVSESVKGTKTEGFFRIVNENIARLGMSLERALFDSKRGAVIFYPSPLVATSMRILVESVQKGLQVAARSLMSISEYVKNIKKINDRLNDLLADIISDMKSNMNFLAPLLSGIIVGLSGMITLILSTLAALFVRGELGSAGELGGGLGSVLSVFDVMEMIPTFWLQVAVGIYLIQIVFILTSTLVTIKSGRDVLQTTSETAKNLQRTIILYFIVALGAIVGLTVVGAVALKGLVAG